MHGRLEINLLNDAICSFVVQEKERSALELILTFQKNIHFKYIYHEKILQLLIHSYKLNYF